MPTSPTLFPVALPLQAVLLWATLLAIPQLRADESVEHSALLVQVLDQTDNSEIRSRLLKGMLLGLEGRRNVQPPKGWQTLADKLSQSNSPEVRELTRRLAQIFGDPEAMKQALAILRDSQAQTTERKTALHTLLTQQNDEALDMLEFLMDDPELNVDAIRGYATMEHAAAPHILLQRYPQLPASLQQAVVETLATRERYAKALVAAVEAEVLSASAIPIHVRRSLSELVGKQAEQVLGKLPELGQDREKLLAKYKQWITPDSLAKANTSKGRAVYEKTCAACHVLYGVGGKIGPELTGSNRANLDYILLNSVDPSYDVPDAYKMVIVLTTDGRVLNGVLAEEDDSRIVLKTVEQPSVVIAKEDIESRRVSEKSMMPDGQLDAMTKQEVIDLIKYLRTTEQVPLPN